MGTRARSALQDVAILAGFAVLSAFLFVAFVAPSWPRTAWGWVISGALGLPLLTAVRMIIALVFVVGPPRYHHVRRNLESGTHVFRYHAGGRTAQAVLLVVRVLAAAILCGLLLWGAYTLVANVAFLRAQFR
jgi:hypothetical protein